MNNIINFVVKDLHDKPRIDYYLSKKFEKLSRSKIKNLILKSLLKINGITIIDPSKKVCAGDNISFKIENEIKYSLKPYDYKLDIIFEDEELIVLNKKSGISIHPGAGNYDNTIVNALISYNGNKLSNIGEKFRPGIVHRIDKDTSGLIVIAKTNMSHEILSKQFKNHTVDRIYTTLVWGKLRPRSGRIENLIRRSSKNRQLMEVGVSRGKKAITNYKTIEVFENEKIPTFSLVECKLETGRTHQIRVHLSDKGNNILGDKHYKKKFRGIKNVDKSTVDLIYKLKRQFLHAKSLGFDHPTKNKRLFFESKLPEELNQLLKKLRNT